MQPYFDNKVVREVCASEFMCVLSVGEQIYVACPYMLIDNSPFGIFMNHSILKKMVEDKYKFYALIKDIIKNIDDYKQLVFYFSKENLENLKKSVRGKISNKNYIDYDFEEELIESNKKKTR